MSHPTLRAVALLAAMALPASDPAAQTAPHAETQREPVAVVLAPSDPCHFYRGRAWGRGISHYTTEMVWACEAIARRRAASVPLGERLLAMEAALERFRTAIVEVGSTRFAQSPSDELRYYGISQASQQEIAERTGVLAALEGIRAGF
jgi:hypothetical protein